MITVKERTRARFKALARVLSSPQTMAGGERWIMSEDETVDSGQDTVSDEMMDLLITVKKTRFSSKSFFFF